MGDANAKVAVSAEVDAVLMLYVEGRATARQAVVGIFSEPSRSAVGGKCAVKGSLQPESSASMEACGRRRRRCDAAARLAKAMEFGVVAGEDYY